MAEYALFLSFWVHLWKIWGYFFHFRAFYWSIVWCWHLLADTSPLKCLNACCKQFGAHSSIRGDYKTRSYFEWNWEQYLTMLHNRLNNNIHALTFETDIFETDRPRAASVTCWPQVKRLFLCCKLGILRNSNCSRDKNKRASFLDTSCSFLQ